MAPKRRNEFEELAVAESKEKLEKPSLYKVLLHNDNFTTMEFVVYVLVMIFNKPEDEAFRIMLQVHNEGIGIAGVYTFEIAETKAQKVMELAREQEYPLMCSVQEA
jgi:ATP-dependent Clp protease adaptor protein ClpS